MLYRQVFNLGSNKCKGWLSVTGTVVSIFRLVVRVRGEELEEYI